MKHHIIRNTLLTVIVLISSLVYGQNQISGIVNYHENNSNPLPNVTLELFDSSDNLVATTSSNNNGEFVFTNIPAAQYTIRSTTSLNVGDINLVDASLILYHLFGWYSFNDYEFIAADVNGSGTITFSDYFIVLISYIIQGNPFSIDDWSFDEINVDLTARDNADSLAVWGTSTGDVEGIWMPGGRTIGFIAEENQKTTLVSEKEVELRIMTDYDELISGFNLNLTYPINSIEVVDVVGPDDNFHYELDETSGILKVIWLDENKKPGNTFFGETLFTVTVTQAESALQDEDVVFSLLEGGMLLDNNSNPLEDVTILLPKINTMDNNIQFEISNYPNPVVGNLNLKITSPNNNYADIYIYDMVGRLVHSAKSTTLYKGTQQVSIETRDLQSGQYIYKVIIPGVETITANFNKTN